MRKKIAILALATIAATVILAGCVSLDGGSPMPNTQLIIHESSSDIVVTADSNHITDSYDIIDVINHSVEHRATPFVTSVVDVGETHVCSLDDKFHSNDVVYIDPVGTQNSDTRYQLHSDNLKLEIETSSSNTISMSYNQRFVNVRHVHGKFKYVFTDESEDANYQVCIVGNTDRLADVKVCYDGKEYVVHGTNYLDDIAVTTSGIWGSKTTTLENVRGMRFSIAIRSDGTATINRSTI